MKKISGIIIMLLAVVIIYCILVRLGIVPYNPKLMTVLIISVVLDSVIELVKYFRRK